MTLGSGLGISLLNSNGPLNVFTTAGSNVHQSLLFAGFKPHFDFILKDVEEVGKLKPR